VQTIALSTIHDSGNTTQLSLEIVRLALLGFTRVAICVVASTTSSVGSVVAALTIGLCLVHPRQRVHVLRGHRIDAHEYMNCISIRLTLSSLTFS
jgi:hypothetical protein